MSDCPNHVWYDSLCPDCRAAKDAKAQSELAQAPGSAAGVPVYRYLLSECVECGWQDQFREDLVTSGQVDGYCDRCNDDRTFNCIERQNTECSDPPRVR